MPSFLITEHEHTNTQPETAETFTLSYNATHNTHDRSYRIDFSRFALTIDRSFDNQDYLVRIPSGFQVLRIHTVG